MLKVPIRRVSSSRSHICFHQPWGFKPNEYVIEKAYDPKSHYNNMSEHGSFELATMNGRIFNRTELLYSEKDFNNINYKCKKLFEKLQKDGNEVMANYSKNEGLDSKNGILGCVSLNDVNNNTHYMIRILDEL